MDCCQCQGIEMKYDVVYPLDRWWIRYIMEVYYNFRMWAQRNPMRNYVHPSKEVEAIIRSNGLKRIFYNLMGPW